MHRRILLMIEICPAILVTNEQDLKNQLKTYSPLFKQIDIDINIEGDSFSGEITPTPQTVLNHIKQYTNRFGVHLMVSEPKLIIKEFVSANVTSCIFYVHQETEIKNIVDEFKNYEIGVTINPDSKLKNLEFYNQFAEVQFMTVMPGEQGRGFEYAVLSQIDVLRERGYKGKISIDGSVNNKTAMYIKEHSINRVSVGSYFSKAKNAKLNKMKLELALNLQNEDSFL